MQSPKRPPVCFNFNALFKPTAAPEQSLAVDDNGRLSASSLEAAASSFSSYSSSSGLWGTTTTTPSSAVSAPKPTYANHAMSTVSLSETPEPPAVDPSDYAYTHSIHISGISDNDKKLVSEQARSSSCRNIDSAGVPSYLGHTLVFTFYDSRNAKSFVTHSKSNPWTQSSLCTPSTNRPVDNVTFEIPRNVLPRFYQESRQCLEGYGDVASLTADTKNVSGLASREAAAVKQYVICKFHDTRAINNISAVQTVKVANFTSYPQSSKITPEISTRLIHIDNSNHSLIAQPGSGSPDGIHSPSKQSNSSAGRPASQPTFPTPINERRNTFYGTPVGMHDPPTSHSQPLGLETQPSASHHPSHHPHHQAWPDATQPRHSPIASSVSVQNSLGPRSTIPGYRATPRNSSAENSLRSSSNILGGSVSSVDSMSSMSSLGSFDRENDEKKDFDNSFKKFDIARTPHTNLTSSVTKKAEKVSVPRMPATKGSDKPNIDGAADNNQAFIDVGAITRGQDKRCTVMVRNIPNKSGFQDFKKFIDSTSKNEYDFLYSRFDFANRCNVGYAFVSFTSPKYVKKFVQKRSGMRWNQHHHNSGKVIESRYAKIQGYENLIEKFRYSPVMTQDESFRPRFYHSSGPLIGQEITFSE